MTRKTPSYIQLSDLAGELEAKLEALKAAVAKSTKLTEFGKELKKSQIREWANKIAAAREEIVSNPALAYDGLLAVHGEIERVQPE
jgi:hypothetical protein